MSGRITPGQADFTDAPGIDTIIDLTSLDWTRPLFCGTVAAIIR
jgi:hypothetical protein